MATFSSVTRQHLLQALAEYDARGGEEFLDVYGFAPSPDHSLVHEGRRYDVKAVLGVAHRFATGRLATPEEVDSGLVAALAILRKRGFEISEPVSAARLAPPRPTAARTARSTGTRAVRTTRASSSREAPLAICPTCLMALPATGFCDRCA